MFCTKCGIELRDQDNSVVNAERTPEEAHGYASGSVERPVTETK